MSFELAIHQDELWDGEMRSLNIRGDKIVLIRFNNQIYAYEDRCVHKSVPLSQGQLQGNVMTCKAHHWQFDVCSGKGLNPQDMQLRSFPIRLDGEKIYIEVGSSSCVMAENEVGPVFTAHSKSEPIIEAIVKLNADVRLIRRASYVRVLVPNRCLLTKSAVETETGMAVVWPADLEAIMPSFKGQIDITEDSVIWSVPGKVV